MPQLLALLPAAMGGAAAGAGAGGLAMGGTAAAGAGTGAAAGGAAAGGAAAGGAAAGTGALTSGLSMAGPAAAGTSMASPLAVGTTGAGGATAGSLGAGLGGTGGLASQLPALGGSLSPGAVSPTTSLQALPGQMLADGSRVAMAADIKPLALASVPQASGGLLDSALSMGKSFLTMDDTTAGSLGKLSAIVGSGLGGGGEPAAPSQANPNVGGKQLANADDEFAAILARIFGQQGRR